MTTPELAQRFVELAGSLKGALRDALTWHDLYARWGCPKQAVQCKDALWHLASNAAQYEYSEVRACHRCKEWAFEPDCPFCGEETRSMGE
jgi:hypothetical protein